MNTAELALLRLRRQHIAAPVCTAAQDLVQHLGAVQAQDFAAAKWALGLRLKDATDTVIEAAFDRGEILRTHVLRPTWHFVAPQDIRWMLQLTAPRVHRLCASQYRRFELDAATFKRSEAALEKTLRGGRQLTRSELSAVLQQAGIAADDLGRLTHLMIHAELEGLVCSGARKGKQHTYALLEERAPLAQARDRDEALAELSRRYFSSRGPATVKDYIWWSGLGAADAKNGLEMVQRQLVCESVGGQAYWWAAPEPKSLKMPAALNLLPNFDEYIVGYTDRSAIFDAANIKRLGSRGSVLFENTLVANGQVVGTWKKDIKKATVKVEVSPFGPLAGFEEGAVAAAVNRYGRFLQREIAS